MRNILIKKHDKTNNSIEASQLSFYQPDKAYNSNEIKIENPKPCQDDFKQLFQCIEDFKKEKVITFTKTCIERSNSITLLKNLPEDFKNKSRESNQNAQSTTPKSKRRIFEDSVTKTQNASTKNEFVECREETKELFDGLKVNLPPKPR